MTEFLIFFIKSYPAVFIFISLGSLFIFLIGLFLIYKMNVKPKSMPATLAQTEFHLEAIAGDNIISTQLDLARAYIEIGKHDLAKKILKGVATQGSIAQKNEARTLLGLI